MRGHNVEPITFYEVDPSPSAQFVVKQREAVNKSGFFFRILIRVIMLNTLKYEEIFFEILFLRKGGGIFLKSYFKPWCTEYEVHKKYA